MRLGAVFGSAPNVTPLESPHAYQIPQSCLIRSQEIIFQGLLAAGLRSECRARAATGRSCQVFIGAGPL